MRGLAILIMLQGHAVQSWMRDDLRGSDLFELSQMVGGLPAPLFLFLTGISLVILLERRASGTPGALWKLILGRSGYIFAVALLFRLQQWVFYWPRGSGEGLLKVDILNTLAVALALAGGVAVLAPRRSRILVAALGAVAVAMLTPLVWALPADLLPPFLMSYLRGAPDLASFPLFPWVSYTFTGVVVGAAIAGKRDRAEVDRVVQWLVLAALILIVAARFFDSLAYTYYRPYNYWLTSPNLVANRTAVVLLLFASSYGWTALSDPVRFSWVRQIGHTSLLIYWVHIELVYGRFLSVLQHRLGGMQAVAAVLSLTGLMLLLSVAKTRWATRRRGASGSVGSGGEALANAR